METAYNIIMAAEIFNIIFDVAAIVFLGWIMWKDIKSKKPGKTGMVVTEKAGYGKIQMRKQP